MAKKKVFQISNALTEGLEETVSAAHNYTGELRVEAITLKRIEMDPENPRDLVLTFDDLFNGLDKNDKDYNRKVEEKASLASLANSINEQGIINPVMVYKFGDKYRLIAGERRSLASIIAGKMEVQAKILDSKPNELKVSLLQWMENVERKDLSLWERLRNLEKIVSAFAESNGLELRAVSPTDLGRLLGCSLPHAMNYSAALNADKTVKELIRTNKLKNLEKAALIATIRSEAIKQAAIDACLSGATLKKLKSISTQDRAKKVVVTQPLSIDTRGRQATHLKKHFSDLNWSDYRSINHAFKQLLKTLEQIEAE
jgi:ParB family chromosome partitioning protein